MKELVEFEVSELLESYGFPRRFTCFRWFSKISFRRRSNPTELGIGSVKKLMNIVDTYIKQPERNLRCTFFIIYRRYL